jgi:hypothetical protein
MRMSEPAGEVSEWILGYELGGNGNHGVAALKVHEGRAVQLCTKTCGTSGTAVAWLRQYPRPLAIGFDTLLAWSSARCGDRPADRALRAHYPDVAASVVYPNALYGAMCVNGALVARRLADQNPSHSSRMIRDSSEGPLLRPYWYGLLLAWPARRHGATPRKLAGSEASRDRRRACLRCGSFGVRRS